MLISYPTTLLTVENFGMTRRHYSHFVTIPTNTADELFINSFRITLQVSITRSSCYSSRRTNISNISVDS